MPLFRTLLESRALVAAAFALATAACGPREAPPAQDDPGAPPPAHGPVRPVLEVQETGARVLFQAVSAVSDSVVWISGHQGTWARTVDGGVTWTTGGVPGHAGREFRDVHAFQRDTAVLLSAGPGDASRLFRTEDGGATWAEAFVMDHPDGFLDCMDFWDRERGLAYGDAVDGELYLLRTADGGRSWARIEPVSLPPALPGEGGFAASGTCLRTGPGGRAWIATGNGERARLLATVDGGDSWSVTDLPLAGGEARGATTVGFRPDGMGFALGGDLGGDPEGGEGRPARVALSADGGMTWSSVGDLAMTGAAYGAAWVPDREPATLLAVGPGGMDWSRDGGMRWERVDTARYWAVDFASPSAGWATGPGGRVVRIRLEPPDSADPLQAGDLVVMGGLLFDGTGDEARPNPGILIRDGTLLAVGLPPSTTSPATPEGVRVLRLPDDATILPGLFDLHAHYAVDLLGEGRVDETVVNPVVFLANGVTSTFPAGEVDPAAFDEAMRAVAAGERPGPRIHRSGPYFGTARPGWDHDAMTPDSIRAEVRHWARRGVRGFKAKGIRPHQLETLVDEAHRQGLPVTGHLDSGFRGSVNPRDAIAMGIDRVEHFLGGDALPGDRSAYASLEALDLRDPDTREKVAAQVRRFVENGVYFDATLTAYDYFAGRDPEVYGYFHDEMGLLTPWARREVEARLPRTPLAQFGRIYRVKHETVRAFVENGGADWLTVGTDHPSWGEYFSGFAIHREMHALSRAGVPNAVVLRAATSNAARALNLSATLGTVEPGKHADLVVIRGDPLADITATRNVLHVVLGGVAYDPAALLASVRGRLGPENAAQADWWRGDLRLGR